MIQEIDIQNFKSIKDLQLDCKRVNIFIGEPNVGKSNILEALSLQAIQHTLSFSGLIRLNDLSNLFFENDPSNKILVKCDGTKTEISYEKGNVLLSYFKDKDWTRVFSGGFQTLNLFGQGSRWDSDVHPYFFKVLKNFPELNYDFLSFPHGENLFFLLQTNKILRSLVSDLIQERGFKLTLRQATNEVEISKEENSILTSYPYTIISDTLQRIIFYIAAIETNKDNGTLIFEEPESNVFPYYTKYLAEKITHSATKQFFLTTHNPYFLQTLIQKTRLDQLQVNIVYMQDYKTMVRPIVSNAEIEELIDLDSSVFLNLDKFLPE